MALFRAQAFVELALKPYFIAIGHKSNVSELSRIDVGIYILAHINTHKVIIVLIYLLFL